MGLTALSPDGTLLAVSWRNYSRADGWVRLIEVPGGRERRPLKGLDDMAGSLTFSPDGSRLAAAGRTVKVWDTATGHDLLTLRDVPGSVADLEFSRDGHRLRAVVWTNGKYGLKTWDATPRAKD